MYLNEPIKGLGNPKILKQNDNTVTKYKTYSCGQLLLQLREECRVVRVHDEGEGQPEGLQPEDRAVVGDESKPVEAGQTLVTLVVSYG